MLTHRPAHTGGRHQNWAMGRISLIFRCVTSAAGTWWFNTVAIGLFLRCGTIQVAQGMHRHTAGYWAAFSVPTAIPYLSSSFCSAMLRDWLAKPAVTADAGYIVVLIASSYGGLRCVRRFHETRLPALRTAVGFVQPTCRLRRTQPFDVDIPVQNARSPDRPV
jgi:hypothetical protein